MPIIMYAEVYDPEKSKKHEILVGVYDSQDKAEKAAKTVHKEGADVLAKNRHGDQLNVRIPANLFDRLWYVDVPSVAPQPVQTDGVEFLELYPQI